MLKFKRFTYQDEHKDGAEGAGYAPAQKQPETFSREYVTELRSENASYRTKAKDAEAAAETARAEAKKLSEEAEAKAVARETAANERIIRAELKAEAIKAGMIDLDGLKLADLSKVKLNDKGDVEGAEELMKSLKESKPYLFRDSTNTSSIKKPPEKSDNKQKTAKDMSAEEWKNAKKKLGIV